MIIKRKLFTQWDETDRLKQMKDSDILAEKKKKKPGLGGVAGSAAGGALVGAAGLGAVGGLAGLKGIKTHGWGNVAKSAGKFGKFGALAGGLAIGGMALHKRNKAAKENQFYNDRLEYAQRQALRREKKDWKQNMTQREGYTY